jgi:peptidoglycan-associated lipoprotein
VIKPRTLIIAGLIALLPGALGIVGCKKKPPADTSASAAATQPVEQPKPIEEPKPAPPPPPPPPKPTAPKPLTAADLNLQKVLHTIYFEFDKYELRDDARQTLASNVEWLKGNSKWRLLIEGHCDERGTNEYNMALGDRRANAAKSYLVSAGIPAERIRTISYGEERPADPGHAETSWAKNRRCEFVIED